MKVRRVRRESPRSILVLKPSSFGDIIHTLPAVARLRDRWPDSRISWLVNTEWSPLLRGNSLIDEVILFPRKELRGIRGLWRARGWLREHVNRLRPDLVLDFQGLLRTALIGRFAGGQSFAGMADAREGARWLYDEIVPVPAGVPHSVERYLALSAAVTGALLSAVAPDSLRFPLPDGEPISDSKRIESRYVLLHPFSRGVGKSLSVSQVQSICAVLSLVKVVVVGNFAESAFALPPNALNLLNSTSLLQLLSLTRHASFVLSVDSGPVHLAAALKKPLVAIHTWSDPRRVGPYLPTAWVVKSGKLLQVSDLPGQNARFYEQTSGEVFPAQQMEAVCRLAISSLSSSA